MSGLLGGPDDPRPAVRRAAVPSVAIPSDAIPSDAIVGFASEDDAALRRTLAFIRAVDFAGLHVFRDAAKARNGCDAAGGPGRPRDRRDGAARDRVVGRILGLSPSLGASTIGR